jgi:hypothetical protein
MKVTRSSQPARAFETTLHEGMQSFDAVLAAPGAVAMVEDEGWRIRFGQWLWQYFDVYRTGQAQGDRVVVAVRAVFEGEAPAKDGKTLVTMLAGDSCMLPDEPTADEPTTPVLVTAASELTPADALTYGLLPASGFDHARRVSERWARMVPAELCAATLFVFTVPVPALTLTCDVDIDIPQTETLDACLRRIEQKAAEINLQYPDAHLRIYPPQRLSEASAQAHSHSAVEMARKAFDTYFSQSDEPRAAHHVTLSMDWVAGLDTLSADIALWRNDGAGLASQLVMPQNVTLSRMEETWRTLGAVDDLPYEVIPTSYRQMPDRRSLRQLQEAPGKWVHADIATLPRAARALLHDLNWLRSAKAEDEEAWQHEVRDRPLPLLYNEGEPVAALRKHFIAPLASRIVELGGGPGCGFHLARTQLIAEYPDYAYLQSDWAGDVQETAMPYDFYLAMHFRRAGGHLFHIRDALLERLDLSDIEVGLPLTVLHAPFPDCYLHLESPRKLDANLFEDGTPAWLRGFYVCEQQAADKEGPRQLALAPIITAGLNLTTAYSEEVLLTIEPDDSRDLAEALHRLAVTAEDEEVDILRRAVFRQFALCAKVLAYLGVRDARLEERNERTERLKQAATLSGSRRRRALDAASRYHDYIDVGPVKSLSVHAAEGSRSMDHAFWRRGHFRMQAHGPAMAMRRLTWIEPTLVNAAALEEGVAPAQKEYSVR